ncbi:MAG: hypothetical protein Ct9H300mP7_3020 [Verrucomicrobiota bacterium]|nr:MAG: hypothetical protein Ct9H300mP7_3020 [Verrucomicrobiota bacterium]
MASSLLSRTDDIDDPFIPLQCWWVLERHCENDRGAVLDLFGTDHFFSNRWLSGTSSSGSCAVWRLGVGRMIYWLCDVAEKRADSNAPRQIDARLQQGARGAGTAAVAGRIDQQLRQLDNPPLVLRVRLVTPPLWARRWQTLPIPPSRPRIGSSYQGRERH